MNAAYRFRCPACQDVHTETERRPDGRGGRRCPECDHPYAEPIDDRNHPDDSFSPV